MTSGRLGGKVAIITGASSGLGPVMAKLFVRARQLASCWRRGARTWCKQAAADCGPDAIAMRADVTNEEDVVAMVARTIETFGQVDVLCNNAATPGQDRFDLGADARELERDHRRRRHRCHALHERGPEAVDARARLGRHHQLLVHRRSARPAPKERTTSPPRPRCGPSPRRSPSRSAPRDPLQLPGSGRHRDRTVDQLGSPDGGRARVDYETPSVRAALRRWLCATSPSRLDVANTALFLASDESRTITGQSIVVDAGGYMLG